VTIATNLGVPRSTARSWRGKAPQIVVSLDVLDLSASELQREILQLRQRVRKLTALLRLALALLRCSGFTLAHERVPDACAKIRILRALDRAREFVPLRALLRFLRVSPSRFHAWQRLEQACALDDQSPCPRSSPHRLTRPEIRAIEEMVTALDYRHVPIGTLAVLAQRLGTVWASPSTSYCPEIDRRHHFGSAPSGVPRLVPGDLRTESLDRQRPVINQHDRGGSCTPDFVIALVVMFRTDSSSA
jgi:putative transposase